MLMFVSASSHGCTVVYLTILLTGAWLRFFWHYLPGEAQGAGPKQLATQTLGIRSVLAASAANVAVVVSIL